MRIFSPGRASPGRKVGAELTLPLLLVGSVVDSFSLTTFSPSGKLVQIEHALAAVGQGTTSLGIKGERAAARRISPANASAGPAVSKRSHATVVLLQFTLDLGSVRGS